MRVDSSPPFPPSWGACSLASGSYLLVLRKNPRKGFDNKTWDTAMVSQNVLWLGELLPCSGKWSKNPRESKTNTSNPTDHLKPSFCSLGHWNDGDGSFQFSHGTVSGVGSILGTSCS